MLTQGESPTHPHHTSSFPACSALNLCLRQGQGAHHSHRQPLKPLHTHNHTSRQTDSKQTKQTHTHIHTHTHTSISQIKPTLRIRQGYICNRNNTQEDKHTLWGDSRCYESHCAYTLFRSVSTCLLLRSPQKSVWR